MIETAKQMQNIGKSICSSKPANIPKLGLSSCEHSLVPSSGFISKHWNFKELPATCQM